MARLLRPFGVLEADERTARTDELEFIAGVLAPVANAWCCGPLALMTSCPGPN